MANANAALSRRADGTQMARRAPNLAHYKEIVDIDSIVQLSTDMRQRLVTGLPYQEVRRINLVSKPNDVYFRQRTGEEVFWWSGREWPNGSFHHLFGLAKPAVPGELYTVVEFNVLIVPPFKRKLGGAYLRDISSGKIWLAHRGIVTINELGGRVSKKQFFEAMAQAGTELTHDEEFALISQIESDNLIDEIEAFTRKARQARENLVKDVGAS